MATTSAGTRTAKLYVGASAVVIDTEQLPGQHTIVTSYLLRDHLGSCPVFEVRIHQAANSSANFEYMRDTRIIEWLV